MFPLVSGYPCPQWFEVEHGDSLIHVKRVQAKEEEVDNSIPDAEVTSGDETDKPVPKKRKKSLTGTKCKQGKKQKPGARTYPNLVSPETFDEKHSR